VVFFTIILLSGVKNVSSRVKKMFFSLVAKMFAKIILTFLRAKMFAKILENKDDFPLNLLQERQNL
jgi:hypothetical protein